MTPAPAASRRSPILIAAVALAVAACAPPSPPPPLQPVGFDDLPGWTDDDHAAALAAFRRGCARPAADWRDACVAVASVPVTDAASARAFFERWTTPHQVRDGDETRGLVTGYFEPELRGSRRPGGRFRVPLYAPPADWVTADLGRFRPEWAAERVVGRVADGRLVPAPTRAEIDAGALAGRGLELVWVDDPIDAFFLHVQGSGRVALAEGGTLRLGYAGRNGHPYVAIGGELIRRGEIEREAMSMQAIRAWLAAHPGEAAAVMALNPSYVFFRELAGDGPLGALGVPLTPGRSVAVDPRHLPLGAPVWVDTVDPLDPSRPLRRLAIAQDTGSAIKGAVRADLFWGAGRDAAERAGRMRSRGALYVLLPRAGR